MLFGSPRWDQPVYWSLDLETGGLDARTDPIISVGLVPIVAGVIRLGEAFSTLIRPDPGRPIRPESVRAHQLLAGDLRKSQQMAIDSRPGVMETKFRWTAPYAAPVHDGAVFKATGSDGMPRTMPARPS